MLQPIEHITHLHEPFNQLTGEQYMDENSAKEMIKIVRKIFRVLEECLKKQNYSPKKIYLCMFNEDPDWHLHLHIIPRAKQEVIVGPHLLINDRRKRKITEDEVKNIVSCLRRKLKEHT